MATSMPVDADSFLAAEIFGGYSFGTVNKRNSRHAKSLNNVLECKVCEDVFALNGDKVPRLLLCGHTLCHSCLQKLPVLEEIILCPFDRQPTAVGSSGVWGLKKNFALLELLERLQSQQIGISVNYPPEILAKQRELSIPCDEDGENMAVVYCTICCTDLCLECSERIHARRTLASHKRVPLSEKPKEKPKCSVHPAHIVEFACLEEECQMNPLMCYVCKDYGRHTKHRHALLEMEAENLRANFITAIQRMRKFADDVSESLRGLGALIKAVEGYSQVVQDDHGLLRQNQFAGTAEDARNRVRSYFRELREQLGQQEVAAMTIVDTYVRERMCSLRQQQEDLSTTVTQVASVCMMCERGIQQDDASLILTSRELKNSLDSIDKYQQQFQDIPEQFQMDAAIPITFTKDNRVHIGSKIEMRVVTLGLDESGKTSILFKLKQNEFVQTIPTIGFNVETVEYKNLKFTVWDVGGLPKLRPLWKHYYLNTQAVIFVIDSTNQDRLGEASNELSKLMSEKELKEASFLIFANKQDLPGAASIENLAETLGLYKLCCGRSWHIQASDVISGQGLLDGIDWLSRQLVAAGVMDVV